MHVEALVNFFDCNSGSKIIDVSLLLLELPPGSFKLLVSLYYHLFLLFDPFLLAINKQRLIVQLLIEHFNLCFELAYSHFVVRVFVSLHFFKSKFVRYVCLSCIFELRQFLFLHCDLLAHLCDDLVFRVLLCDQLYVLLL